MMLSFLRALFRRKITPAPIEQAHDPIEPLRELIRAGEWERADELGAQMLLLDPVNTQAMAVLAYSLQQRGRLSEAAELAAASVLLDENQWLSNFVAGVSLKYSGFEQQARDYLRRAKAIHPTDESTVREFLEVEFSVGGIDAVAEALAQMPERNSKVCTVLSVQKWVHHQGFELIDAGDVEAIPYSTPKVFLGGVTEEKLSSEGNKPYVADLSNVRIYSSCSFILTDDGHLLSDLAGHPRYGDSVSFQGQRPVLAFRKGVALLDTSDYRELEIEGGIWLAGLASNAFGHWLPEFLPKLEFMMKHPDFVRLPIIVDEGMPPSHIEYLRRIAENSIVVLPPLTCFVCRRLLVAPTPTFYPVHLKQPHTIPQHEIGALSPRALRFLQISVGKGELPVESPQGRVFLARRNMHWRRLLNEEEICEALGRLGFVTIYPEDLTLAQQIAMFNSARWIVAPNGSALLNLIFAQPGSRILILAQPHLYNWGNFQGPMEELGYQPLFLCGEEAYSREKHSDYQVPLPLVLQALSEMGLDGAAA